MVMVKCGNNGCGKEYDSNNTDDCWYHSGSPVFHEGLKGWSCCSKRVIEFEEFLQIPGCVIGNHKEKTVEQQKVKEVLPPSSTETISVSNNNNNNNIPFTIPKPEIKKPIVPVKIEYIELNDPEDAVITENAKCTRNGCNYHYINESSKSESCTYHPGDPVFHEGSKGWSCCKPKAAIFEEFLKIKGCKAGKHKFIPEKKDENFLQCRHDWYQNVTSVILAVYAKQVDPQTSQIEFVDNSTISLNLQLPNGKFFKKIFKFASTFNIEKSKYDILKTKIEFQLYKDPQDAWSKLEDSELDLFRYQV